MPEFVSLSMKGSAALDKSTAPTAVRKGSLVPRRNDRFVPKHVPDMPRIDNST